MMLLYNSILNSMCFLSIFYDSPHLPHEYEAYINVL